ncbi:MAG: hypothetical protein A3K19_34050 [Lentisphaerae bacterium RIFOXYB12_FULL_65_16]|nr:MAG: hypothetical protein A3K19_34050 [Lentisphaerae bacterium RIFOXYB12_FULL_65_16]
MECVASMGFWTNKMKSGWGARIVLALSIMLLFNFFVSLIAWGRHVAGGVYVSVPYLLGHAGTCVLLFAASFATVMIAFKRSRIAVALLLVVVLAAGLSFCYDINHGRWQYATGLFSPTGTPTAQYCTWWWYTGPVKRP